MNNSIIRAIRWIIVLPAAFGADFLVTKVFLSLANIFGEEMTFFLVSLLAPIVFLYLGMKIAPSNRYVVAVTLAALRAIVVFGGWLFIITGLANLPQQRVVWRLGLLYSLCSTAVTVFYCIGVRKSQHPIMRSPTP
jgi:hypothetical protein